MFVSYCVTLAILVFAYEEPDVFLLIVLFVAARYVVWRT